MKKNLYTDAIKERGKTGANGPLGIFTGGKAGSINRLADVAGDY